jgi:hypothetical protein
MKQQEDIAARLRRIETRLHALMQHEGMSREEIVAADARSSKRPQPEAESLPRIEARLVSLMLFSGMQTDGRNPLRREPA